MISALALFLVICWVIWYDDGGITLNYAIILTIALIFWVMSRT